MKMEQPKQLVLAEDVPRGKPDPACYLMGTSRLGLSETSSMLVVEDAPSGVRAGKAAGFKVVALATTHKISQLQEAGADWIVRDMRSVTLSSVDKKTRKVTIQISNAFVAHSKALVNGTMASVKPSLKKKTAKTGAGVKKRKHEKARAAPTRQTRPRACKVRAA